MFATVTRQLKRAMSAVKSVLAFAGAAATELDPRLKAYLEEGGKIDGIESLMTALVRWIESDNQRLQECEAKQRRAERQLTKLRLHRDRQQEDLYSLLIRIRTTFEDAFGQGMAEVYLGLAPKLSKLEPIAFRRVAQETVNILRDDELALPEPKVKGLWENPVQYAEQILELLEPFQDALDTIESQKREVEKAQKAKIDLLQQLRGRLTWSIRLFEAIYQLADLGYHAKRLRLTVSSRPNTEAADTSGDDSADGDDSAAEPPESSEGADSASES